MNRRLRSGRSMSERASSDSESTSSSSSASADSPVAPSPPAPASEKPPYELMERFAFADSDADAEAATADSEFSLVQRRSDSTPFEGWIHTSTRYDSDRLCLCSRAFCSTVRVHVHFILNVDFEHFQCKKRTKLNDDKLPGLQVASVRARGGSRARVVAPPRFARRACAPPRRTG